MAAVPNDLLTVVPRGARPCLPGVLGLAVVAVLLGAFFYAESEWEVGVLLAIAAALGLAAPRVPLLGSAETAWRARPRLFAWLALLAALGLIGLFREEHLALLMLATALFHIAACMGLNVQFGYCGVVNFAGAAFFGIGCYTAAMLAGHAALPTALIFVLGGACAALIGCVLLVPVLRTRGHYAALVTLAFGVLFRSFMEVNDTFGGPQGVKLPDMTLFGWELAMPPEWFGLDWSFYVNYALLGLALVAGLFVLLSRLERSWIGLALDVVRLDETAAATFGVQLTRWKIFAFVLGNFLMGVAGAMYAVMIAFVAPSSFTLGDSLILVSIVVLGGVGNQWGLLPAVVIVMLVPEKLQFIQEYRFLLYGLLVIAILLFKPDGLLPRRLRRYGTEEAA